MEQTEKMVEKQKKEGIASIIAVILLYGAFKLLGFGCPIKLVTGISCAGCGMTRAWEAMFHFHIEEAFYYHPLFFYLLFLEHGGYFVTNYILRCIN